MRAHESIANKLAAAANTEKEATQIPEQYAGFEDVFKKEDFDTLPPWRLWDHVIELKPGSEPSGCKIYPLNPEEQKELDSFIEEHLRTGRIQALKSPMASPFFL